MFNRQLEQSIKLRKLPTRQNKGAESPFIIMTKLIDFFLKLCQIREKQEKIIIRDSEIGLKRFADHAFQEALFSFLFARELGFDPEKLIKTILVAKIYKSFPKEKEWKEILSCLPPKQKEEFSFLKKQFLDQRAQTSKLAKEIILIEKIISLNKDQAHYYYQENLKKIRNKDLKKVAKALLIFKNSKKIPKNNFERIAKFLIKTSYLETFQRRGWVLRGVKDPETVAQHTFHFMVSSWVLGRRKGFEDLKMILLALVHDLCEVYAGDKVPYLDDSLRNITKEMLKKPPRVPRNKKIEWLMKKKQKEWQGIKKITEILPSNIAREIRNLWIEFEERLTKEGRFVYLLDKVENLFQATNYWLKDKNFPIVAWWIHLKEMLDDPLLLKVIAALDRKFQHRLLKLNGPDN